MPYYLSGDCLLFANASLKDYDTIEKILRLFHEAIGKSVNFEKCTIIFSPNTIQVSKCRFLGRFIMTEMKKSDNYLFLNKFW